jgi:hypothetical protein
MINVNSSKQRRYGLKDLLRQEAEAVGLKEVIIWLGEMEISRMLIELDCKLVVEDVIDTSSNQTKLDTIIKLCRSFLSFNLNFEISFIRRQVNCVAHHLTRASKLYVSHQIFEFISIFCFVTFFYLFIAQ